jgi:hypothetical protein
MLLSSGGRSLAAGNADQAAQQLRQAVERLPASVFAWRQLARAERLRGDPAAATAALEQASALAPTDPLVQFELARAYEAAGDPAAADQIWKDLGFDPFVFAGYGNRAFESGNFIEAYNWFKRSLRNEDIFDDTLRLQYGLSALISGIPGITSYNPPDNAEISFPPIKPHPDQTRIPGAEMRWFTSFPNWDIVPGTPLGRDSTTGPGTFFWNGAAILIVEASNTGSYVLRVQMRDTEPAGIRMHLRVNGNARKTFSLTRGDGSLEIVEMPLRLRQGLHLVTLEFLSNDIVNGQDRDAIIEWIELTPVN